jgi:hypothetical protein
MKMGIGNRESEIGKSGALSVFVTSYFSARGIHRALLLSDSRFPIPDSRL